MSAWNYVSFCQVEAGPEEIEKYGNGSNSKLTSKKFDFINRTRVSGENHSGARKYQGIPADYDIRLLQSTIKNLRWFAVQFGSHFA